MNTPSRWVGIDAQIGVACVLFSHGGPSVATTAPIVLHRRSGIDVAEAQGQVRAVLTTTFDLPDDAVTTEPDGDVTLDLAMSSAWIDHVAPSMDGLTEAVMTAAAHHPDLRSGGRCITWSDAAHDVGTDALRWAVARSSSRQPPVVIAPTLDVWRARTDDNPLSLVRRAHAAIALAGDAAKKAPVTTRRREAEATAVITACPLRPALLLADRAAHDAGRSSRARPLTLALEALAAAALDHLERTPEGRTDLPALEAARRVLGDALRAAQVVAPVPY